MASDRREFVRTAPARTCGWCGGSRRRKGPRGAVCADCGEPWPTFEVGP